MYMDGAQPEEHLHLQHTLLMHPKFIEEQISVEQPLQQTQLHGFSIPLSVEL